MQMKRQSRVVAFDDGKFGFREGVVPVVGIIARLPSYVEGALVTECTIDGMDSTQNICKTILRSRFLEQLRAVLLDGIACGGFNVFDLGKINSVTGLPVLSVTRKLPNLDAMRAALQKYFDDWEERYRIIREYESIPVKSGKLKIHASWVGLDREDAVSLLKASIFRGNYPEALRLAHSFASAITRGESRGKA